MRFVYFFSLFINTNDKNNLLPSHWCLNFANPLSITNIIDSYVNVNKKGNAGQSVGVFTVTFI